MNTSRVIAQRKAQRDAQRRATVRMNYTGKILAKRAKLGLAWDDFVELMEVHTGKHKLELMDSSELHCVNAALADQIDERWPVKGVSDEEAAEIIGRW